VSFERSSIDGTLTFLNKVTRNDPYGFYNPTCPFALNALDGAYQVAISPDGQYGYVSSILDNKVVVLYRATNGALAMNPLGGPVQIFSAAAADLSQAYGMAISPDGTNMYLTGYGSDTLLVLKRNAADGTLTQVEIHTAPMGGRPTRPVSTADIAGAGTASVTVFTLEPGGGDSNTVTFTIGAVGDNPVPALASATLTRGSDGSLRLMLNGSGFVGGATVQWNGANRPTTFVNATRLTLGLSGTDLLRTPSVLTVMNPGPGGGTSNDLVFSVRKAFMPLIRK
jgi:hypothetical protein